MNKSRATPDVGAFYLPWMKYRRCEDYPPEMFFPDGKASRVTIDYAKAVCEECPVRTQCLELALSYEGTLARRLRHGIWGSCTPDERYRIAMERQEEAA